MPNARSLPLSIRYVDLVSPWVDFRDIGHGLLPKTLYSCVQPLIDTSALS